MCPSISIIFGTMNSGVYYSEVILILFFISPLDPLFTYALHLFGAQRVRKR